MKFIHAQFIKKYIIVFSVDAVAFKTNTVYCNVLSKIINACLLQ